MRLLNRLVSGVFSIPTLSALLALALLLRIPQTRSVILGGGDSFLDRILGIFS